MKSRYWPYLVKVGMFAAVYLAAGKLGLRLAFDSGHVSTVWPATGIALAGLLIWGYRYWPGVALGAFLVNALTPVSLATACGITVGNTLEALLGAWLLHRFVGFRHSLDRLRDVLGLVALAALFSTMASSTIGVLSLCLGETAPWSAYGRLWWQWWVGDALGDLVVAPLLLTWGVWLRPGGLSRRSAEAVALLVGLITISQIIFGGSFDKEWLDYPHWLFPFVIWAALRFGQRGVTAAIAVISGLAIWHTLNGFGPFVGRTTSDSLILLQAFVGVTAVTGLILAAITTERRQAEEQLQAHARQRAAVAEFGQSTLVGPHLSTLMEEAVAIVAQTLRVDYCKILELLPDGNALLLRAGRGWTEGYVGHATVAATIDSQAGYTLLCDRPVIVEDLRTETRFSGPPLLLEHGVVSGMSVIIRGPGRPFGILGAHSARHRTFTEDDIHFLQAIANVLATAIERQRAEEALRASEQRYRSLFEQNLAGVFRTLLDGRILDCNQSFAQTFGFDSPDEVLARRAWELYFDPADREALITRLKEQGYVTNFEQRLRRKDGSPIWVLANVSLVGRGDGAPAVIEGTIINITQRQQAEAERARHAAQLQGLAEASLVINSALSLDEVLKVVTEKAREIIGAHQSVTSTTVGENWAQAINAISLSDKYAAYRAFDAQLDGSGIYSLVCETNRPMRMTQAELEAHSRRRGFGEYAGQHPPMRGWLAAPLIGRDGRNLGLIHLSDKYDGEFAQDDEAILVQLAQMASVAVENARLYQAEQHARQTAEILRAANLALTQTLDLDVVLETLLDFLARLVPYDSASVLLLEGESRLVIRAIRGFEP